MERKHKDDGHSVNRYIIIHESSQILWKGLIPLHVCSEIRTIANESNHVSNESQNSQTFSMDIKRKENPGNATIRFVVVKINSYLYNISKDLVTLDEQR